MSESRDPKLSNQGQVVASSSDTVGKGAASTPKRQPSSGVFVDASSNMCVVERPGIAEHIGNGSMMVAIRCK